MRWLENNVKMCRNFYALFLNDTKTFNHSPCFFAAVISVSQFVRMNEFTSFCSVLLFYIHFAYKLNTWPTQNSLTKHAIDVHSTFPLADWSLCHKYSDGRPNFYIKNYKQNCIIKGRCSLDAASSQAFTSVSKSLVWHRLNICVENQRHSWNNT